MNSSGFKAFLIFAFAVFVSLLATPAHSYGFGAKAGPFEVVLETDEPEQDFVIRLDNYSAPGNHGPGLTGGGYIKITHGPSNTPIHFPRDWLYKWNSAGEDRLSGLVMHPKYLTVSIHISPDPDKSDEVRVNVQTENWPYPAQRYNASVDRPILIRVKMIPIELYLEEVSKKITEGQLRDCARSYYEGGWVSLPMEEKLRACRAKKWILVAFRNPAYFHYFAKMEMLEDVLNRYKPYLLAMHHKYVGHIPDRRYGEQTDEYASRMTNFISRMHEQRFHSDEMIDIPGKLQYEIIKQK